MHNVMYCNTLEGGEKKSLPPAVNWFKYLITINQIVNRG